MPPEFAAFEHFHFLRPAWALVIIPWLLITLVQNRRRASRDSFGGIIAPHLLEHLRLQRFERRWFNPVNVTRVFTLLLLLVLMGLFVFTDSLTFLSQYGNFFEFDL